MNHELLVDDMHAVEAQAIILRQKSLGCALKIHSSLRNAKKLPQPPKLGHMLQELINVNNQKLT